MSKPIRRGISTTEPTRITEEKVHAGLSNRSAKYRPRAIPNKFKEASVGRVFVWISYPFAFGILWNAVTKAEPLEIHDLQTFKHLCLIAPFCGFAVFGLKSYTRGAVLSLVCSLIGITGLFF